MNKNALSFIPLFIFMSAVTLAGYFLWFAPVSHPTPIATVVVAEMPTATPLTEVKSSSAPTVVPTTAPTHTLTPQPIDPPTVVPEVSSPHTPTSVSPASTSTPVPPTHTSTHMPIIVPSPSPLPPATITPTPAILEITEAPVQLKPLPYSAQYKNRIELEWEWSGTLGTDDYYQVEIRNRFNAFNPTIDETVSPIDVAWVKNPYYQHDYVDVAYDREYTWRVVVVRGTPPGEKQWSRSEYQVWEPSPDFEQISDYSEMWTLFVEEADGPPPPDTKDNKGFPRPP